ncbi:MAG: zinc-ribbon domain-containing protein [Deltaproteobacteria bacterium]|jgi:predicted Zn finger-like uncharacterized protein|nr:zinc-ribbon domain-containing protein [Deltaproteobacteria bacterium]
MKITCSNCQKKYRFNSAKIPVGVTTAKCKACGHPMPLRGKAPADRPAITETAAPGPSAATPVIKQSCLYCGQDHILRRDKIPSGTASIKCKSCGRPMALKLGETAGTALVHSLKKEASETDTAGKPLKAVPQPPRTPEVITLTCTNCRKRYKIRSHKIPPTATSLKCRVCGHRIKLPVQKAAANASMTAPLRPPPVTNRPLRKTRLYALAAGFLLLAFAGLYAGLNLFKDRGLEPFTPGDPQQSAAAAAFLRQEPFLALNLNLPLILKNIDQRVAGGKKNLKFRTTMSLVKSLRLKRLEVYLYADRQNQILPVVMARGHQAGQLEKIVTRPEALADYFDRESAGIYRLKPEAFEQREAYGFPDEPYQMIVVDKGAVFAPAAVAGALASNQRLLQKTAVAEFAASIADPRDLARIAVRIPEDLPAGWYQEIQNNSAVVDNPQVAMIAAMGSNILAQLTDALKPVESLALGFRFTDTDGRALSYAQQFRPGVDGNAVYQKLNAGDLGDGEVEGIIQALLEFFQDPRYQHDLQFADNRLELAFGWLKKDDTVFWSALSKATLGHLFAQSTALAPTPGPVVAEYADDPQLFTTVDGQVLKPKIPQIVKQCLFPGNYRNFGTHSRMTLELDPLDIPNAALAQLTYEVGAIRSTDGRDILGGEENQFKPTIKPGSAFPGQLMLRVRNEPPAASLGTAIIQFRLSLPDTLQIFEFRRGEEKGQRKKAGGIQVTLERLEKDVAAVTAAGGQGLHLIAYDKTGQALASRESVSSASSVTTRFQGVIDKLKVVAAVSLLEIPFEVEVDLNGGRELKLPPKPVISNRIRYNHQPLATYRNFSEQDVDTLAVAWREAGAGEWADKLEVQLPKGPFSGYADWEVHLFGQDKPQLFPGNPSQGTRDISYRMEKGRLADASAAFGIVALNIRTDIERLSFTKKDGGKIHARRLVAGDPVTVDFNKNEISYGAGNAHVIQVAAYDSFGKRLKQGSYSSNQGGRRKLYFWGQPFRFEMDLATRTRVKKIKFDIRQRPLAEAAYLAYQQTIEHHRSVVATLKSIDRARRQDRTYYGDDLAGLYYLYDRKTKQPMQLLSKEIAHSDPAGQNRFDYKAQPFNGYYFTILSGVEVNGVNKEYKRRSKKTQFVWKKGRITTAALTRHPDLVAIPADTSQPTFFLQWGQVFMKPLKGESLEYLPGNFYENGWVEAQFIEG